LVARGQYDWPDYTIGAYLIVSFFLCGLEC